MLNIGTFSIGFPDGKLFFVGHKEDINELINYYDNREPGEKLNIYEVIYIVVKIICECALWKRTIILED